MKKIIIFISLLMVALTGAARQKITVPVKQVADVALKKGIEKSDIKGYEGSLLLQGMCELALASGDTQLRSEAEEILRQFGTGEIRGGGSFISYEAGGSGAAYLAYHGTDMLRRQVTEAAKRMMQQQSRSSEGLMVPSWVSKEKDQVFIDMAFAVTPYLLYSGLIEQNNDQIDMAVEETAGLFRILHDDESGLIHQGRGFVEKGRTSDDCWSRGNGWGAVGLGALATDLPRQHKRRKEVETLIRQFYASVLKYQDAQGMWHQEMTDLTSYPETSGTGLLLYGMGKAIEAKILGGKYLTAYKKGLQGLAAYVAEDGSVANACWSCLCPKQGTKADYKNHPTYLNDDHAFGPVVLAYAQALRLGIKNIDLAQPMGSAITQKLPRCYVRFVPERSEDIAWENDRVAFRVYSRLVNEKVGSGVDLWTKSVGYSVIDGWYALNDQGLDYHSDRGEGYDFYTVGRMRGCGGTGIWRDGQLYVSEPYANYRILRNDEDGLAFTLTYQPYQAAGVTIYEQKTIRMVRGTNFYQVEHTIETSDGSDAMLAVGLTNYGKAQLLRDKNRGLLSLKEHISDKDGDIGTMVVANPAQLQGFGTVVQDELAIIRVRSGQPTTYYVGAGWSGDPRFDPWGKWDEQIGRASYDRLNTIYKK